MINSLTVNERFNAESDIYKYFRKNPVAKPIEITINNPSVILNKTIQDELMTEFDTNQKEDVTLEKLSGILEKPITISDIINFPTSRFASSRGIGETFVQYYKQLKIKSSFLYFDAYNNLENLPFKIREQQIIELPLSQKERKLIDNLSAILEKEISLVDLYTIEENLIENNDQIEILNSLKNNYLSFLNLEANKILEKLPVEIQHRPVKQARLNHNAKVIVAKLSEILERDATYRDVITFPESKLKKAAGVGKKYLKIFAQLKNQIVQAIENNEFKNDDAFILDRYPLENYHINLAALYTPEMIEKNLVREEYANLKDFFTNKSLSTWKKELKQKLKHELLKNDSESINEPEALTAIIPLNNIEINDDMIDRILSGDLHSFVKKLEERDYFIFIRRNGFYGPVQTLENISQKFGITRERVRQIDKELVGVLKYYLRVNIDNISEYLKAKTVYEIDLKTFPNLGQCFKPRKNLIKFLKRLTDLDFTEPFTFNQEKFEDFFANNAPPVSLQTFKDYIIDELKVDMDQISNYIDYVVKNKYVDISDENNIKPLQLTAGKAVAHILCKFPGGLHWRKAVDEFNAINYTGQPLRRDRILSSAFAESKNIYLIGEGKYRHVKFLDVQLEQVENYFEIIVEYLKKETNHTTSLRKAFSDLSLGTDIDYFPLRYFLKYHGEEKGIYFYGMATIDSVSLFSKNSLNLESLIIQELGKSENPLSIKQIAKKTGHRNLGSLNTRICELNSEGKIVRSERKAYTTPDRCYEGLDKDAILSQIQRYLNKYRIVDLGMLKDQLNNDFNLQKVRFFYLDFLKTQYIHPINRIGSLLSIEEIPYNGIYDLLDKECSLNSRPKENYELVKNLIWISKKQFSRHHGNWKSRRKESDIQNKKSSNEVIPEQLELGL